METWLAIASRREVRNYAPTPVPAEIEERILDAGRLSGSSQNRQQWRFVVVESPGTREALAGLVYAPGNVRGAQLVVAIVVSGKGPTSFDAGRCAQSMLLAAWDAGVGGCPNGTPDADAVAKLLDLGEGERPAIVLTFGYPAAPRDPAARSAEEWSARAGRKRLTDLVERV
ncbi:MAG TPA: nitroreductase family protein [Gaiellaceae bacterium]|nr:nitroreductase family protein [Gaiellaceae bacterium]